MGLAKIRSMYERINAVQNNLKLTQEEKYKMYLDLKNMGYDENSSMFKFYTQGYEKDTRSHSPRNFNRVHSPNKPTKTAYDLIFNKSQQQSIARGAEVTLNYTNQTAGSYMYFTSGAPTLFGADRLAKKFRSGGDYFFDQMTEGLFTEQRFRDELYNINNKAGQIVTAGAAIAYGGNWLFSSPSATAATTIGGGSGVFNHYLDNDAEHSLDSYLRATLLGMTFGRISDSFGTGLSKKFLFNKVLSSGFGNGSAMGLGNFATQLYDNIIYGNDLLDIDLIDTARTTAFGTLFGMLPLSYKSASPLLENGLEASISLVSNIGSTIGDAATFELFETVSNPEGSNEVQQNIYNNIGKTLNYIKDDFSTFNSKFKPVRYSPYVQFGARD